MNHFERIVIGIGGIGSATVCELARRGVRTLGLDQFRLGHDRGSSHGSSRIIRQAYFENPAYVPMLRRADALWCQRSEESGQRLFDRLGLLEIGPPDGVVLPGVEQSAREHKLDIVHIDPSDLGQRFPGFSVPDQMGIIYEPAAGLLHVERCVETSARLAVEAGAELVYDEVVHQIASRQGQVSVRTNKSEYQAAGVIICAGAWSPALELGALPLRIVRKHLHWFQTDTPTMHADAGCPVFFYEMPNGFFYGFPAIDSLGVKLAEHSGGEPVIDPSALSRDVDPLDTRRIDAFRRRCLPHVSAKRLHHAVCMYTQTPDEHFIVDHHPHLERTVFAAGLSGHGFKFAPVLAEILVDLSLNDRTEWDIDFLRADRFTRSTD